VLELSNGVVNAIDLELVEALARSIDSAREDPEITSVVLATASDKFFSIGFDVPELLRLDRSGMTEFVSAFDDLCLSLFALPKPTVAAVTAHAIAGGCILALCCDYRMVSCGRCLMGLNEVRLGVPLPLLAQLVLGSVVGDRRARDVAYFGDLYEPEELLRLGIADAVLEPERILEESMEKARSLGSLPREAFTGIKEARVDRVEREFAEGRDRTRERFLDCWFSDETRSRLEEAAAKVTR